MCVQVHACMCECSWHIQTAGSWFNMVPKGIRLFENHLLGRTMNHDINGHLASSSQGTLNPGFWNQDWQRSRCMKTCTHSSPSLSTTSKDCMAQWYCSKQLSQYISQKVCFSSTQESVRSRCLLWVLTAGRAANSPSWLLLVSSGVSLLAGSSLGSTELHHQLPLGEWTDQRVFFSFADADFLFKLRAKWQAMILVFCILSASYSTDFSLSY